MADRRQPPSCALRRKAVLLVIRAGARLTMWCWSLQGRRGLRQIHSGPNARYSARVVAIDGGHFEAVWRDVRLHGVLGESPIIDNPLRRRSRSRSQDQNRT